MVLGLENYQYLVYSYMFHHNSEKKDKNHMLKKEYQNYLECS